MKNLSSPRTHRSLAVTATLFSGSLAACTGQNLDSFRYAQQEETFGVVQDVNTKIDLLWVVDNSASMDVAQNKLRQGFSAFANKYMLPTWDIRVAVITTDTYIANTAFSDYLDRVVPGTVGWQSTYVDGRKNTWVNPSWNSSLLNTTTGVFTNGIKYKELVPAWGATGSLFSRLLPGLHDGPVAGLCTEYTPTVYFYNGTSQCSIRDDQNAYNGTAGCLNPNTGLGETSVTQCVNTVQNDTVRSGKAIIETMPPAGTPGDNTWKEQLIDDFMINITTGSAGHGSERGLGSVLQLLDDNESTATAFFRSGSARGIIFVSDENDQTMDLPAVPGATFHPLEDYKCDEASLVTLNAGNGQNINGAGGYCCAAGCTYGSNGTSCAQKTVDGYTYTPSICPRDDLLVSVSSVKSTLDTFFQTLDGSGSSGDPNYFVVSIVPTTGQAIQDLQADRTTEDNAANTIRTHAVDRGDRYIELGTLVGNGSLSLNLAEPDYSDVLEAIGQSIIEKKSTFYLSRPPTGQEDTIVKIIHGDGSTTIVSPSIYTISGNTLRITDLDFVLALTSTDRISINYQPATAE